LNYSNTSVSTFTENLILNIFKEINVKTDFYLTCTPGLEFMSSREVEHLKIGYSIEEKSGKGRVFFRSEYSKIPEMHCVLRTAERIVLLLERCTVNGLDEIYRVVKKLDFSFIEPEWSFAVRSTRAGNHDFTSIDIGRVAGKAVIDSYMESRGVRLRVNLDEPDVIVRCDLIGNDFMVGIDMTGDEGLHRRRYRVYQHPAPLNPVIAASLVYLSEWYHKNTLLDPFCGSGTILFEAGMMARNIPICRFRKDFAFTRFFSKVPETRENRVNLKLYGVERFRKHVEGARIIAKHVHIYPKFLEGYAERINEYFDEIDFIITNPPYGFRIGKKKVIEDLYSSFLKSTSEILKKKLVLITAERNVFEKYAREYFEDFQRYDVRYGGLITGVYVIEA